MNSSSVSLYLYVKLEAFLHKSAFKIINKKLKEVYPNLPNTKEIEENLGKLKFNTNLYVDLIHYLIIQYFRTEKQIDNLKNSLIHLKKYWKSQYADYQLPDYVQKFIGLNEDSFIFIFIHLKSIYLVESLINLYVEAISFPLIIAASSPFSQLLISSILPITADIRIV